MRAITIIVLLWVIAVMAVSGWRYFVASMSKYEVDRQGRLYQEAIDREVGK